MNEMTTERKPSRERGCRGKVNLGRVTHIKQSERMAAKHGKRYGVYECPHCGGHHLTTKIANAGRYQHPLIYTTDPMKNEAP